MIPNVTNSVNVPPTGLEPAFASPFTIIGLGNQLGYGGMHLVNTIADPIHCNVQNMLMVTFKGVAQLG